MILRELLGKISEMSNYSELWFEIDGYSFIVNDIHYDQENNILELIDDEDKDFKIICKEDFLIYSEYIPGDANIWVNAQLIGYNTDNSEIRYDKKSEIIRLVIINEYD